MIMTHTTDYNDNNTALEEETAAETLPAAEEEEDLPELAILVQLAPSCRLCRVDIQVRRPTSSRKHCLQIRSSAGSTAKRARLWSTDEAECPTSTSLEADPSTFDTSYNYDRNGEENQGSNRTSTAEDNEQSKTLHRRMPRDEILQRISTSLPTVVTDKEEGVEDDYLTEPYGCVLKEYKASNGGTFCLTLANGSEVADYHNQVQRLALFFIETADDVNVADESSGSWKVLYLFQKHVAKTDKHYSLVGYMTLYHFTAPFRKPQPGVIVRVCQALILPPYQRAGHGQCMLRTLHEWADGAFDLLLQGNNNNNLVARDIVEINIEDPAPGFTVIRNRVDYQRFLNAASQHNGNQWFGHNHQGTTNVDDGFFDVLKESELVTAAAKAKTTTLQMQIVYEIYKLHCLQCHIKKKLKDSEEQRGVGATLQKRYRIMVKKRLQKLHREAVSACQSKPEMQALLTNLYEDTVRGYERILKRISGQPPP